MTDTPQQDTQSAVRHPLDVAAREHFHGPRYKSHLELWDKASDRLISDPDGAITAARALLETTCKQILDALKIAYEASIDLPKLYNLSCTALGMSPGSQIDPVYRSVFSSTYQIVNSVSEIRNRYGDAHGRNGGSIPPSRAEAELAVHMACTIACFIVRRFESHLNLTRRLTADGEAVLWFDKSLVWRLIDHATNSPKSARWYGKRVGRCLLLVGDSGIYLMSNGIPKLLADGTLAKAKTKEPILCLVS